MPVYISILRGINVSGARKIAMADLKALYENLHLKQVTTYIQSGNVIFSTDKKIAASTLINQIETAIQKKYNFEVPVIIRTAEEMENIIAQNPFLKEKNINIEKLHVTFLGDQPAEENTHRLKTIDFPPDRFIMKGKEIYIYCPDSYGNTKLSNNFFENRLKVSATTRNWKSVNKLVELCNNL
jgi:uncharacterized protein (DUF1697 family)